MLHMPFLRRRVFDCCPLWSLLLLSLVAFAIRFWALQSVETTPSYMAPLLDEEYHLQCAAQINSDDGFPRVAYFRAPAYLYFVAIVDRVTGDTRYYSRLLQILIGSLLPAIMLILARRLSTAPCANVVAWITVLYPSFIFFETTLLLESFMAIFTATLLWSLMRCEDKPTIGKFAVAGLIIGVTAITRPNILVVFLPLAFWFIVTVARKETRARLLARAATLVVACGLVILPVTIRNAVVSDDFVLVAWQGGINFFLGNHQESNGWSAAGPGMDGTWRSIMVGSVQEAENDVGKYLKPSEISDYWYSRAKSEITADISGWLGRLFTKCRLLINGYEIPNDQSIYYARNWSPIFRVLVTESPVYFPYGILAPLAILGAILMLADWRRWLLVYVIGGTWAVTIVLFFVNARFRVPLLPLMILFAVPACFAIASFVRQKRWSKLGISLVVLVGLMIESNRFILGGTPEQLKAQEFALLASSYESLGQPEMALDSYKQALAIDSLCVPALAKVGRSLAQRGKVAEAKSHFRKVLEVDPYNIPVYLILTQAYLVYNHKDSALSTIIAAQRSLPFSEHIQLRAAEIYLSMGDSTNARIALDKALKINPDYPEAISMQQQIGGE